MNDVILKTILLTWQYGTTSSHIYRPPKEERGKKKATKRKLKEAKNEKPNC